MSVKSLLNLALAVSCSLAVGGCGGEKFETAPAKGSVTFGGKKVTGGTITLSPVASGSDKRYSGKAAIGTIQSDGTFVLTTYGDDDGAIIGKHQVTYSPPEDEGNEDNEGSGKDENTISKAELKKRDRNQSSQLSQLEVAEKSRTVEITAGDNVLKIELSKKEADEGDGEDEDD